MKVFCTRRQLSFINHGKWNDETKKYEGGHATSVEINPQPGVQEVPDWIRNTDTFAHAKKAGLIVEVELVSEKVKPIPPTLEEVLKTGMDQADAEAIVAEEQRKFDGNMWPYGPNAVTPPEVADQGDKDESGKDGKGGKKKDK